MTLSELRCLRGLSMMFSNTGDAEAFTISKTNKYKSINIMKHSNIPCQIEITKVRANHKNNRINNTKVLSNALVHLNTCLNCFGSNILETLHELYWIDYNLYGSSLYCFGLSN